MKKVLITGGAGFVGSALVRQLRALGRQICVYDNLSFGRRELAALSDEELVIGDVLDAERLRKTVQDFAPEQVVHLAAVHFIPYCNQHPFESANINIRGTSTLLEALTEAPSVEKVLFASTAAVYPVRDGATSEECPPGPTDIYGLSKYAGEELCRKYHLETGVPTFICRFFNAFGPNETNPHLIPAIEAQLRTGARTIRLGNLDTRRDFVHTRDLAKAIIMMLDGDLGGLTVVNIGSGHAHSGREVVQEFERAIGAPIEIASDAALTRASDRPTLLADVARLHQLLGWTPQTTLREGISELCAPTS